MFKNMLDWLGFGEAGHSHGPAGHSHGAGGHGHTHGVVDPTIATTSRGIWAIKWSFVMLAATAAFQFVIVYFSGSVALLADTIHNVGDAATAIPLWIAFVLVRRKPSLRFTYGLGRVEDIAGVIIVAIILFSAVVAGWESIERLIYPKEIAFLGWVTAAGIIGFIGNEAVAVFRIRVGREIDSAALIADGYHARVDGLTSLAVVVGALGVWLGFPLADPIVGLVITAMILGIVWQSGKAVFTRMLDGTEPDVIHEIEHVTGHVEGIRRVEEVRARWLGHRLAVELDIAVDGGASLAEADAIANALERELAGHIPALGRAVIRIRPHRVGAAPARSAAPGADRREHSHPHGHNHGHRHADRGADNHPHPHGHHDHHDVPAPVSVSGKLAAGELAIVDTPHGERMRLTLSAAGTELDEALVVIDRGLGTSEVLPLRDVGENGRQYQSDRAPAEPHAFEAELRIRRGKESETVSFRMSEPEGRDHEHAHGDHAH
jgi:cation diffusion facilitator family transporter